MSNDESDTPTLDGFRDDGWAPHTRPHSASPLQPRLRLLYHPDLSRLGAVTLPGAIPHDGSWLTLGRGVPRFSVVGGGGLAATIEDPLVSREQLRIRWLAEVHRFEVDPLVTARRPLLHVALEAESEGAATTPITGPTLLPIGAAVAIGDRILLGLELGDTRAPTVDRLGLVGESDVAWALRDEIISVAAFSRSALVSGPTGAGKELVARALHRHSRRAAGPFVAVNCAALPEKLVESALFGHKKGAFTGADTAEKGLFSAADGGTLFLDELAELPLAVQPKLLRALQEGVVVPVGTHDERRVDLRVVAASHRDLEAHVRDGTLREDLYHRLSGHVLRVAPLSARRFDIPELFIHVLGRLRREHPSLEWLWESGREWQPAVPVGFIADLMRRAFPGNVRELQNIVERTARLNLARGTFRSPDGPLRPPTSAPATAATPTRVDEPHPVAFDAEVPEALVRGAADTLGLARKTVLKLISAKVLLALSAQAANDPFDDGAQTARLRARASEALLVLLGTHDYNQSAVAVALGTSRTTLIKLMDDLGFARATGLTPEEISRARAEANDDLDVAAKLLRVSPGALKRRVALDEARGKGR
jgi:two-component system nitrogen regulation response regulator GlnG